MAAQRGIPAMTVTWNGISGTSRAATVFNTVRKKNDADSADTVGNVGQWLASRRRNKRIILTVECKPLAATMALAAAITADLPMKNDLVSITGATDTELNSSSTAAPDYIVEGAPEVSYSPENEAIISFDLKCYLNDDNTHIVPAVLADS